MHRPDLDLLLVQLPNLRERAYLVGVASLKAFLTEKGFRVECYSPAAEILRNCDLDSKHRLEIVLSNASEFTPLAEEDISELLAETDRKIRTLNPRYLGFSVIFGNLSASLLLAKKIKALHPNLPILLGGPGVMLNMLEKAKQEVSNFIFYGDAEHSLLEFLNNRPKEEILGMGWKTEAGWKRNPNRPTPKGLLSFPQPDYSDFKNDLHAQSLMNPVPLTLGRGCPFRCKFCAVKSYGLEYRHFSVESCIEHLRKQVDAGKTHFYVHDPITNGNPGWIREFAQAIIQSKLKIHWGGNIRLAKYLLETETLDLLAASGFRNMITGLESGSPKVLRHMKKYADLENIHKIFNKVREIRKRHPLEVNLQLIVGYPNENEHDFEMTLKIVQEFSDIITEIASCSAFLVIPSESDEMIDLIQDPELQLKFQNDSNWSTPFSSPEIRFNRMQRAERLFQHLNLPYRMFYMDRLQEICQTNHRASSSFASPQALQETSLADAMN